MKGRSVRVDYDQLSMDEVLAAVAGTRAEPPPLEPVAATPPNVQLSRRRMLQAHEALAALGEGNREKFENVVTALRKELDKT